MMHPHEPGPDRPEPDPRPHAAARPAPIAPGSEDDLPRLKAGGGVEGAWPDPPEVPPDLKLDWSVGGGESPSSPHRFDVELFEQLNREYESKPLVPQPRDTRDRGEKMEGAQRRLNHAARFLPLEGTRVLELGCGQGQEVWLLRHKLGCDAFGIDVVPYAEWLAYRGPGVSLSVADAAALPFADASFDRVISFAVWEHIRHPFRALAESTRILRPGGMMWLYANLHRGPSASHRYREIFFPWPHLLFGDDVFEEFYRRRGQEPKRASWVNRLTYETYAKYFNVLGLEVLHVRFAERDWDQAFYERFIDVLGRYPVRDLKRDFVTAMLRRPLSA